MFKLMMNEQERVRSISQREGYGLTDTQIADKSGLVR